MELPRVVRSSLAHQRQSGAAVRLQHLPAHGQVLGQGLVQMTVVPDEQRAALGEVAGTDAPGAVWLDDVP